MAGIFGSIASGLERKQTDISALTYSRLFGDDTRAKAGTAVSTKAALQLSTVLACVRVLADGVAQVPLKVFRELEDGSKEPAKDHPTYKLLWRRPNEWLTSFDFRRVMMVHAVLNSNAYAYIGWGGTGTKRRVIELIPICGKVTVRQGRDYKLTYQVSDRDGVIETFSRENILHVRGLSWNGIDGMDAVGLAREAIGLALATEETQSLLHSNGAKPGGLLSFDKPLGDAARARLKLQVEQRIAGMNNAFKTMILDNGAKWTPFNMKGVDTQHLETRKFQIEEICRAFGVFPQMIGHSDKTSTFASAEAFFSAHVIHTLAPWYENWQQVFARDLYPDSDDIYAEFSVQGLLRGDHKARAEYYQSGIMNGWLTRNDARRAENLNPLDGLDEPIIPLNMSAGGTAPAGKPADKDPPAEGKAGRVLSAANERRVRTARDELSTVLSTLPEGS